MVPWMVPKSKKVSCHCCESNGYPAIAVTMPTELSLLLIRRLTRKYQDWCCEITVINLPWRRTNRLRSRPLLLAYIYSSGSSTAGSTFHTPLLRRVKVDRFHIFKSVTFQDVLHSGEYTGHMGPCLGSSGVDGRVKCRIWSKIAPHNGPSVPLPCRDEFVMHHIAFFLGG